MKTMERNKVEFSYLLYLGKTPILDGDGNEIGTGVSYGDPVTMYANVSPATGFTQTEQFGTFTDYDKVIVTDDMSCPINENTVLFIDKPVEFDAEGKPLHDYVARRVAKSLNSISIAISKVIVS